MKRAFAFLTIVLLTSAAPVYAVPFTWTISGVAGTGSHLDLSTDISGLAYVLRLTTDSNAPDQNAFNDFGTYGFNNIAAEIDIAGFATHTLGNFTFVEQFTSATSDRLRIRGPNGGAESVLQIPLGTLGDPDFLSLWGPVKTTGASGLFTVDDPGIPNAPFHLVDADNGDITVQTTEVPEPATLALIGLGAAVAAVRARRRS
jgi:PEP-CTERM motif